MKKHQKLARTDISSSKAKFLNKTPSLKNEDPDGFTCHLSFNISKFSNLPHKDNDASPFTFFMWIPIEQATGNLVEENFEVKGGEFVFPDDSCATAYSHLNIPYHTPSNSLHTHMGLSCQLAKKTQVALEKIKQNFYEKDLTKCHWGIRDMNKIISESLCFLHHDC
ncbi:hypothetical protein VP01_4943g1 [Puccinia sorghi]|uniref:Tet-like 2OG-Fe(II) oxygenase domain-containing protein n=1 Tax=Puccinia sorghi TaxID=27349 RepID=A0A0L6UM03_9BASI|nr:hypothetical protein VP01_4943g1 [Puccinia sorghi]